MKKEIVFGAALLALVFTSCGGEADGPVNDQDSTKVSEETSEDVKEESIYGVYSLTDMIPVTDGKELTKQDEAYISDSKERTLNKTTLTLNEDGSFERVFPHPSGDGSMNTWTGSFTLDEESGDMIFDVEMNGKKKAMDFTLMEKTAESISLKSSFGQIYMTYVYTKK